MPSTPALDRHIGVYYALKENGSNSKLKSKRPPTSALYTFDNNGILTWGRGDSIEATVRVSAGLENEPLLFFVLRDSYSRIGAARFVIAACNGRQFTADFVARVVVGIPRPE